MPSEVWQLAGSLVAILGLVALAHFLGLSRKSEALSNEDVADYVRFASKGFAPERIAIDTKGDAALARASDGRIMLVRRHGAQFHALSIGADTPVRHAGEAVFIGWRSREVALHLEEGAAFWERAIRGATA